MSFELSSRKSIQRAKEMAKWVKVCHTRVGTRDAHIQAKQVWQLQPVTIYWGGRV